MMRARLVIRGAVQGVGFRPFIHRLAIDLGLKGWVNNSGQGVLIEVEGAETAVQQFVLRIEPEKPPHAFIQSCETTYLDPAGYDSFEIRASDDTGPKTALVLPDIATCPECRRELFDPANRRHRYPFTNCTHCGPRFSIIEALPYDRANTTMRRFVMCPECRAEYENPADRRFHAQPNACPNCGPQLEFWDSSGQVLAQRDEALRQAEEAIRQGQIVAVKGLGGFQLLVDARNEAAVRRLRQRKQREEKPFALMCPYGAVRALCAVTELEARLLNSAEAPIILLRRNSADRVAAAVAPGNPYLGVMLPYTPLHHLLLADLGFPVVATSGNLSDEPICIDEQEAKERLGGIADAFLVHNRPIARQVDDSVARVLLGREQVLRRARGYAPLPVMVKTELPSLLAVGAHLKNTVALARGKQVFLSQHIGDLETVEAHQAFQRVISDLHRLLAIRPASVVCDWHPDYLSSQFARQSGLPLQAHQHHAAHVAACRAENELTGPVLGVSWDGTGLGTDNTVWGGEFIVMDSTGWQRAAHLHPFLLPGGEAAIKEPRRSALGVLFAIYGDALFDRSDVALRREFTAQELAVLRGMLARKVNCPATTSAGRLFDAVASLAGLRQQTNFEGQSAMALEWAGEGFIDPLELNTASRNFAPSPRPSPPMGETSAQTYPFELRTQGEIMIVDWRPMIQALLTDRSGELLLGNIAAKFHRTLAEIIVAVARRVGEPRVALTGGCFQNRLLTELAVKRLRAEGFTPYWHQRVPPNDGGIALGQAVMSSFKH